MLLHVKLRLWQFPLHACHCTGFIYFLDVLLVRIYIYYNLMTTN